MAEKKASPVYSGGKDAPNDYRDPNEVVVSPTPAELDPRDNKAHYRSPEHELDPGYEATGVPPEVTAGGTGKPFEPEPYETRADKPPALTDTSKPFNPKEPTDA